MSSKPIPRVIATQAALSFMAMLRQMHGALMFFQSGGCCDGSVPQCYAVGEFNVSTTDVYLGDLDGAAFYIGADQFEYWKHTQLIIDVAEGNGGMFSLDNGTGKRFITRSRLLTDEENRLLEKANNHDESSKPTKEQVRAWLARRLARPMPLPSLEQIRQELGWATGER